MSIEEPQFAIVLKDGAFEIRDYTASIVAEVTVTGDQKDASGKGFRLLASYIFGANATRQKIAMTAPVTKTATSEKIAMTAPVTLIAEVGQWFVRFTMPARYTLADLPVPTNNAVTIKAVPASRSAVLRFSGLAGEAKVAAQTKRLMAFVAARGLTPVGPSSIARYNPPWTLWFLRRNEVMLPVAVA